MGLECGSVSECGIIIGIVIAIKIMFYILYVCIKTCGDDEIKNRKPKRSQSQNTKDDQKVLITADLENDQD